MAASWGLLQIRKAEVIKKNSSTGKWRRQVTDGTQPPTAGLNLHLKQLLKTAPVDRASWTVLSQNIEDIINIQCTD